MNLKNVSNLRSERVIDKPAIIRINRSGVFSLSKGTIRMLGLEKSHSIAVYQDQDNLKNWFLRPLVSNIDKKGLPIMTVSRLVLGFHNKALANKLLTSMGVDYSGTSFKVEVAGFGVNLFKIDDKPLR